MPEKSEPIDRAFDLLPLHRTFRHGERTITIAFLIRTVDWRPLNAPWWRGKEVYLIGADYDGNFLLRHCDGTIRYWDHRLQTDTVVAASEREFASRIKA